MTAPSPASGPPPDTGKTAPGPAPVSVLHQIFGEFADTFGAQEGRNEVAERLRHALIKNEARSEAALRAALFGSDGS